MSMKKFQEINFRICLLHCILHLPERNVLENNLQDSIYETPISDKSSRISSWYEIYFFSIVLFKIDVLKVKN